MDKAFAIFDMDGTLVDSMGYWKNVGYEFLAHRGIRDCPPDLWARISKMTLLGSAGEMIRLFDLPDTPQEIIAAMNGMMARHYQRDISLKPAVPALLERLDRRGTRMCVASATDETLVRDCLARLGVLERFDFILSCEQLGVSKRQSDIYLEAVRRFGCDVSDAAVFEDALYAAQTAARAGFYVVGVYDENASEDWERLKALAHETLLLDR